jgi:hypothetical protein
VCDHLLEISPQRSSSCLPGTRDPYELFGNGKDSSDYDLEIYSRHIVAICDCITSNFLNGLFNSAFWLFRTHLSVFEKMIGAEQVTSIGPTSCKSNSIGFEIILECVSISFEAVESITIKRTH